MNSELAKLLKQVNDKKLTRREVMKLAATLGLSSTAVGLVLGACAPRPTPSPTRAVEPSPTVGEGPGPSATPATKAKIVCALQNDVDTLETTVFKGDAASIADIHVYERPIDYVLEPGPHDSLVATFDYQGVLAESYTVSADGKTITLRVRPGVEFSNGNPCDAEALYHTFMRNIKGGGVRSNHMAMLFGDMVNGARPEWVEKVDDYTIVLHLAQPNPMAEKWLTIQTMSILDPRVTQSLATEDDPWADEGYKTVAIGTGPYTFENWVTNVQWELVPNPKYRNASQVKNGGVLVKNIPSAEDRLLLLAAGDLDWVWGLPARSLAELRENPDINVLDFPSISTNYMGMDNSKPPFDDIGVRQAICYALNYEELVEKAMYGFAQPLTSPVPNGMDTHADDLWPYTHDPDKAKALLREAGYPDGFDTSMAVKLAFQDDVDSASWVQAQLAEVGINVEIELMADAEYFQRLYEKTTPMFIGWLYSWINDPFYQLYFLYHSTSVINWYSYGNPEMDRILEAGFFEPDPDERARLSRQGQQIALRDMPFAFLQQRNYVIATRANVHGFVFHRDAFPRLEHMYKT